MTDATNRTLTIKRVLNAPIQLVWDAWTQPEHIAHWWGPGGMKTRIVDHDFSVGGSWKFAMDTPDGKEFICEGIYKEIEAPHKIITSADFKPMTENVELQILLEADGEKTNFTFNVVHETAEYCKQQKEMGFYNGWGSVFDNLAEYVSKAHASG